MQSPRLRNEAVHQLAIGPGNREVGAPMGCAVPSRTAAKSNTAHCKRSGSRGVDVTRAGFFRAQSRLTRASVKECSACDLQSQRPSILDVPLRTMPVRNGELPAKIAFQAAGQPLILLQSGPQTVLSQRQSCR
jgi:hypothetical protein